MRGFTYFRPAAPWSAVLKRTAVEINDDNVLGLAAQLAFYFLLALFPAMLFFVALLGYVPIDNALDELLAALDTVAPAALLTLVRDQLEQITAGSHASLLTIGIAGAIWSSSAAMVAIIDAMNRAYDISEWRPWLKRRVVAIVLTVSLALFTIVALTLVLIGPDVAAQIAAYLRLAPVVAMIWAAIRWPVLILCVVVAVDLVYHFAPNRPSRWSWITPGALVATVLWIVASFGFKFYVTNFTDYTATYGAIGGAIVTMLWFYVSGLAILVGAELNGVIEHTFREARAPVAATAEPAAATPER